MTTCDRCDSPGRCHHVGVVYSDIGFALERKHHEAPIRMTLCVDCLEALPEMLEGWLLANWPGKEKA